MCVHMCACVCAAVISALLPAPGQQGRSLKLIQQGCFVSPTVCCSLALLFALTHTQTQSALTSLDVHVVHDE